MSLIHSCMSVCVVISETEVLEHRQWYMRYQRLAEEKKRAVKLWRTRRDAAREEAKRVSGV